MRLSELFPGLVDEAGDGLVTGITADSRAVRPGFVFAALQGVAADGRRFAPNARWPWPQQLTGGFIG